MSHAGGFVLCAFEAVLYYQNHGASIELLSAMVRALGVVMVVMAWSLYSGNAVGAVAT